MHELAHWRKFSPPAREMAAKVRSVKPSAPSLFLQFAPIIFVLIWSTGWISAQFGAYHADPLTFLSLRFALAGLCMLGISLVFRAPWPKGHNHWLHAMASGVLLHALYLGGVWWAIHAGLASGLSGLIAALQPILTALLAPLLIHEKITRQQWLGIAFGFAGIVFVLHPKFASLGGADFAETALPIAINSIAMLSVTLGTFYQKRFVPTGDLRTITALQYCGAFFVILPAAYFLEPMQLDWSYTLVSVMAWSVVALSLGAIGLLLILIRNGAVSRAATLIYLVPPAVALQAYFVFGETLDTFQIGGMALSVAGVALATRK